MLAVVKTPRINLKIEGQIPDWIMVGLKREYGKNLTVSNESDDESLLDITQTKWYRDMKKKMTPGATLRIYRQNRGLTQDVLGKKLGGLPRQHVSGMEKGTRGISKATAKKISDLFHIPLERLI